MPTVNNLKMEDLSAKELEPLIEAINEDTNVVAANMMKMALFTGMRRGELFNLKWKNIDFNRGFILLKDPKGGHDSSRIPQIESTGNLYFAAVLKEGGLQLHH